MPATNTRVNQLRRIFADASDTELRQLHAEGAETYTFDAWYALDKEFARRGLGNTGETVEESPPSLLARAAKYLASEAARTDSPPLSEQGEEGQRQLRIISTVLFLDALIGGAVLLARHAPYAVLTAIFGLSFVYFLTTNMLEGRGWARWVVVARNIVTVAVCGRRLFEPIGGADVAINAVTCLVFIGLTLPLVFSRSIRLGMAEANARRQPPRRVQATSSARPPAVGSHALRAD